MKFDFGIIALFFAIPAFLPQVIKLYKDNDTESFSKSTVKLFWLAQLFWIIHGIQRTDLIITTGASINLLCFSYIIYKIYKKKYNL
tara:strand:- start:2001 stop:2258 length:258 start_codon:yes stop_codon:yes gene_type:complete